MISTAAATAQFFSMEHLHVLLNHFPIIGLAMGILALALALAMRSRPAQIVALVLMGFSPPTGEPQP